MDSLSISKTYAGKHVLIAGASGFLGKVWLSMLLHHVPEVARVYVLMRKKGTHSAQRRFQEMISSSHAFHPLHEKYGAGLATFLMDRVEVLEGDVTISGMGVDASTTTRLQEKLDLFVNCAGLVDFNPDLRDALKVNVEGALYGAEFVETCHHAQLLHISTVFVVGIRDGYISEDVDPTRAPNDLPFDSMQELSDLRTATARIVEGQSRPEFVEELRDRVEARQNGKNGNGNRSTRVKNMLRLLQRRALRDAMVEEGKLRAAKWGWTNTYTFTKSLGERLLALRADPKRFSLFRPAIVESAMEFPFAGWNEGFNTSGPLAYLLGSWFRYLPSKKGNPFDVVPVDSVCRGMLNAGAALMERRHQMVYHCGTSDLNRFTIDRACELTSLGHRIHLRKNGKNKMEKYVLSRWDAVSVPANYPWTVTKLKGLLGSTGRFMKRLSDKMSGSSQHALSRFSDRLYRLERKLAQVEELLKLFKPFIHDHSQVFECKGLVALNIEEEDFRFYPQRICWREYWIHTHMPGLRRWCFPMIEGKEQEQYVPESSFVWPPAASSKEEKEEVA